MNLPSLDSSDLLVKFTHADSECALNSERGMFWIVQTVYDAQIYRFISKWHCDGNWYLYQKLHRLIFFAVTTLTLTLILEQFHYNFTQFE